MPDRPECGVPVTTDVPFNQHAERQGKAVEAIRVSVSEAVRRDLDALRAEFDARFAAFEAAIGEPDVVSVIERLVAELSDVAARDAEKAATQARHDAEQAAAERQATAQADAQTQLEQERSHSDGLRRTIKELQAQMQEATIAAQSEVEAIRGQMTAALDEAREAQTTLAASLTAARQEAAATRTEVHEQTARLEADERNRAALVASLQAAEHTTRTACAEAETLRADNHTLRRTIDELRAQMDEVASTAQTDVQGVRAELTAALDDARETHATLSASLAAARQETAIAQSDLLERTARLEASERLVQASEAAQARVEQALATSEAQRTSEAGAQAAFAEALEAAHQETTAARGEAESCRAELCEANMRLETVQQQLAAQRVDDSSSLVRVRHALGTFEGLTTTRDAVKTFIEAFGREFDYVALFVVRGNRLQGWRSVGATDVSNLVIPLTIESPLTRAVSAATSIVVESNPQEPTPGLVGHEIFCAMAFPIVLKERVVAVAYAELGKEVAEARRTIRVHIAEILIDQLIRCLTGPNASAPESEFQATEIAHQMAASSSGPRSTVAEPSYPGPPRASERLRISQPLEVLIDGGPSWLVDISTGGAQILCPRAMRPNRPVRMLLPRGGQQLLCQGHVVWARLEMAPEGPCYRAGLRFATVEEGAVEAFMHQPFGNEERTSA
jgi:hypothetical protein